MMHTLRVENPPDTSGRRADARWLAVLERDRAADGAFVYAVRTTGVYCRPTCPARRPRREHVMFFGSAADADRAGFRACKRCRPLQAQGDPWVEKIRRACVYLANVEGGPSLARMAATLGGSPYHLQRNFKRLVGVTPREYAEACRLRKVKRGLRQDVDVTTAVLDAGYGSSGRFYERAVPRLGMAPAIYKKGGAGMDVRYAVVPCPLGSLLVAATERGVCAINLGASAAALERGLTSEFPSAVITKDGRALGALARSILASLTGRRPLEDLPLDIQATAFQWQVWNALRAIPRGQTRSYAEVARSIGRATSARAVARACATNPVALAIPCHRVVPSGGGFGGYRWGKGRKQAILADERRDGKMPSR